MSIQEYKESIKSLVDATNDERLLRHWQEQLKRDVENQPYSQPYDEKYILSLRKKAKAWLGGIDSDQWLREIRGSYEA